MGAKRDFVMDLTAPPTTADTRPAATPSAAEGSGSWPGPKTEKDKVMRDRIRVDQLGDDRLVVADDARKQRFSRRQLPDEIVATSFFTARREKASGGGLHAPAADRPGFDLGDICHKNVPIRF